MLRVLSFYLDGVDHNLEQGVYMYREFFFFFFSKERVFIQLLLFFFFFFLSELVLKVTAGLEVGTVLLTDQTTGE